MTSWRNPITVLYPLLSGAIFLGLGVLTLIRPEVLEYYSIGVDSASARTAIRAMIGGGEIGIGLVLLGGGRFGFSFKQRSSIAVVIFGIVGLVRIGSAWIEGGLHMEWQPLREAFIELALALIGVWVVCSNTK